MPKASSSSTPAEFQGIPLFVFMYNNERVLAACEIGYNEAVRQCRKVFSSIPANHKITFHTKELPICAGFLTEINEDVWGEVIGDLSSVTVLTEEGPHSQSLGISKIAESTRGKPLVLRVLHNGDEFRLKVQGRKRFASIYSALAKRFGGDDHTWKLMFEGNYCHPSATIEEVGIENGDTLFLVLGLIGGKPVIYLFSPATIEAGVKLSLLPQWSLSAIYPVVPIKPRTAHSNEQVAWRVRTHSNGDLTELTTGLDVAYLFWEAHTDATLPLSPPASPILGESRRGLVENFNPNEAALNNENSVVMPVAKITPYLDKALGSFGLHTEARTSFITYWLPSMLKHKHLAFRFLPQASYEKAAPLEISPSPDVIARVFMIFQGVPEEELHGWAAASSRASEDVAYWRKVVGVDLERTLNANLFRVLEWGGMEVRRS
ncbi:hypothetical protein M413DRAFT_30812 [Hebeloma cylindrosporum]|uniref:Ubiquitin-like domain-containing protein n=1 Tax=Hebeloma cylindrosporum TaxID=76867 RepID=A0A0C3C202_HEBCY|nr:hypothetical protein M413DRAFT_30812 [Hebeloma cylindrosporum h7]